jgi:hypothetical protein
MTRTFCGAYKGYVGGDYQETWQICLNIIVILRGYSATCVSVWSLRSRQLRRGILYCNNQVWLVLVWGYRKVTLTILKFISQFKRRTLVRLCSNSSSSCSPWTRLLSLCVASSSPRWQLLYDKDVLWRLQGCVGGDFRKQMTHLLCLIVIQDDYSLIWVSLWSSWSRQLWLKGAPVPTHNRPGSSLFVWRRREGILAVWRVTVMGWFHLWVGFI